MLSLAASNAPKSIDEAFKKRYQFWETQPVPKLSKSPFLYLTITNGIRVEVYTGVSRRSTSGWSVGDMLCLKLAKSFQYIKLKLPTQ